MISLILLKLFTFSQILQGVPKLSHATVYIRDSIQTEQHMVNIILYREHEMKTIINTIITVHIYLCSAVWYELV